MTSLFKYISFVILLSRTASAQTSDIFGPSTAFTTRYWDCCKPSCGWSDKASFVNTSPVRTCDVDNKPLSDFNLGTGCNGGTSFACANNSPWAVNDTFSYGFVGAHLKGGDESKWCCACYQLTFTTGPVKGKTMIVQASNTDYEMPDENVFTFGIPGGNTSYAGACAIQYGVPNTVFGTEKVGVATKSDCDDLPALQRDGCRWRFDWFENADAPKVEYKRVSCPAALTDITGCVRTDDTTFEAAANGTAKSSAVAARSVSHFTALTVTSLLALMVQLV